MHIPVKFCIVEVADRTFRGLRILSDAHISNAGMRTRNERKEHRKGHTAERNNTVELPELCKGCFIAGGRVTRHHRAHDDFCVRSHPELAEAEPLGLPSVGVLD